MSDNKQFYYCNVEGNTDVGCQRKANEDWYGHFECKNGLVSVVCDGMGGHVGGATASHLAVDTIQNFLEQNYFDDPRKAIIEACNVANAALLQRTQEQPDLAGMGATCVMLIVRNGKVYIGSIGDSRIYLIRSKTITQLTTDQSYVQMLVDAHEITKEQAEHHPRKNEILNAIGLPTMQPATVLPDPINPEAGDIFLLCSDGLSGMVPDREILKIASNQVGMTQRGRVNTLIQKARKNGGHDNITCLLVEFSITPPETGRNIPTKQKLIRYGLPALAALLLLGFGGYALWKHFHPGEEAESDYVKEMKQKKGVSVLQFNDTIPYNKGRIYIEIEGIKGLGAHVYITDKNGKKDTIAINKPIQIDSVVIMPDSNFTVDVSDLSGRRRFKFNEKKFDSEDVSLTFKHEDSTYVYVFPVENQLKDFSASGNGAPRDVSPNQRVIGEKKDPKLTVIEDKTTSSAEDVAEPIMEALEATFKVEKSGKSILKLISSKHAPTETEAYTSYAIEAGSKNELWYSYTCDGHTCTITVDNTKIPNGSGLIVIPLQNADGLQYTIRVNHKK